MCSRLSGGSWGKADTDVAPVPDTPAGKADTALPSPTVNAPGHAAVMCHLLRPPSLGAPLLRLGSVCP